MYCIISVSIHHKSSRKANDSLFLQGLLIKKSFETNQMGQIGKKIEDC